jgi:cardiolipin synthase
VPPKPRRAHRLWGRVSLVVLLFHVLGLLSSMHAVINSRSAQGAIAWGVSLNTFPYVAVPAYWVLGRRSFQGYVEAWRNREEEVEELHTTMRSRLAPFVVDSVERIPGYEALKRLSRTPYLRGNDVDLLIDGAATFDSIFAGLAQAQQYALVEFYIVHDDGLGRRLQAAMADCARRGVEVYFLYDEVGSHNLPGSYLSALEAAGVRQSKFNTTQGAHNRFQINFRNHRKIVVVDGQVAWIGGHNVGDEYLGLDPEVGHWRDTHVRIEGPAAQVAQTVFLADWYWATRTVPSLEWQPRAAPGGGRRHGNGAADRADRSPRDGGALLHPRAQRRPRADLDRDALLRAGRGGDGGPAARRDAGRRRPRHRARQVGQPRQRPGDALVRQ